MESVISIERELVNLFAAAFGLTKDELDTATPLVEMGADSLLLFDVADAVRRRYGVRLTVRQFFADIPTIGRVAEYISRAGAVPGCDNDEAAVEMNAGADAEPPSESGACSPHLAALPPETGLPPADDAVIPYNVGMRSIDAADSAAGTVSYFSPEVILPVHGRAHAPGTMSSPQNFSAGSEATVPFRWLSRTPPPSETAARRDYLAGFIPRYTGKTSRSRQHAAAVRRIMADSRSGIGFKPSVKEMLYPLVCDTFGGAEVGDIDGNGYVDMTMGFGAHLFGHQPDFIISALQERLTHSFGLGTRSETALTVAGLITELTGMDRVAFVNSGTEAVMNAVRAARAYTRRDHLVIFTTSYHGHWDAVLATPGDFPCAYGAHALSVGIPQNMVADVSVLAFGSEAALEFIEKHRHRIAAVMVEPVPTRDPRLALPDYLRQLRTITASHGIVLIFDEIVTGFRVHPAGIQGLYGIKADIVTYGKTIGGGMPLGVIAGRGNTLDAIDGGVWSFGDDSYPATEATFFGGTYFQHPLSMAAAQATLTAIKGQGVELSQALAKKTDGLVARLNQLFRERRVPITACSFSSFFRLIHRENLDLLYYNLLLRGIYIWEWRCWFLSAAHANSHLDRVVNAFRASLDELAEYRLLPNMTDRQE
ncbi:aminotransferase class III-fold pyridoxal phosphate-dependent enzyme [Sodalis sp. dw_96]|uniref:aminotransferase class III-fold pyridoxal phosphate-dependent enzyme n=1 Tax=Sodalis sp. dw_96 TaxID=2719794 RepID=UPI001BD6AD11|nr:aminotransferase class III-fold pyridoxal phosphate-dependent enzyme [Sodalis sp. dw_96]